MPPGVEMELGLVVEPMWRVTHPDLHVVSVKYLDHKTRMFDVSVNEYLDVKGLLRLRGMIDAALAYHKLSQEENSVSSPITQTG